MTHYIDNGISELNYLTFPTLTPVNAVNAVGTLTFTGVVADTQLVTIGSDIYEFDTNSTITSGHIAVDVSGGVTAPEAVTALVAAITANTSSVVTAVDGTGDTVVATAKIAGVIGNSIVTTETCTNGSWGDTTLKTGVDGTVTTSIGLQFEDSSYYYLTNAVNSTAGKNWLRIAKGSVY
jgi:phage tail sheath gpL-like